MRVELSRDTFARLVQLYLASFALGVPLLAYETLDPDWSAFSDAFDALAESRFGPASESVLVVGVGFGVIALVVHVVAAIGLLSFRSWARSAFWTSMAALLAFGAMPGVHPYWTSFPSNLLTFGSEALFGAILLLAYSQDHGGKWFAGIQDQLTETFT